MVIVVYLLLASIVVGQVWRVALPGQGGGLLLSDIAVVIVLLSASLHVINRVAHFKKHNSQNTNNKQNTISKVPKHKHANHGGLCFCDLCFVWTLCFLFCAFSPFIIWSLFTLALNANSLNANQLLIALAYWVRLNTHLLLLPALLIIFQASHSLKPYRRAFIITAILLTALGFMQIIFLPNLADLPGKWDPHQGRLTSTWLDPNFFGAYLALVLPPLLVLVYPTRRLVAMLGIGIALLFTQSRSALVALAAASLSLSPLIAISAKRYLNHRLLGAAIIVIIITVLAGLFLPARLLGLVTLDATVQLRLSSLSQVWPLAVSNSFFGVGYNAYQFTALPAGLISDFSIHSRAGADNSLLTLWVTTGIPGLILFLVPWFLAAHLLFRRWLKNQHALAIAALISLLTLVIHSQFVNSWLYSHLLITLAIIVALALYEPDPT